MCKVDLPTDPVIVKTLHNAIFSDIVSSPGERRQIQELFSSDNQKKILYTRNMMQWSAVAGGLIAFSTMAFCHVVKWLDPSISSGLCTLVCMLLGYMTGALVGALIGRCAMNCEVPAN